MSTVGLLLYIRAVETRASAAGAMGLWTGIREIYARMSRPRRRQLFLLLALLLAGAVAELATIGAVIPFLALLAKTGSGRISVLSGVLPGTDPLLAAAFAFILFAIVAGVVRLLLARLTRSFVFRLGHELNAEIQRRVLFQPFSFHIHRNTSTLLSALQKTEGLVFYVLLPLMYAVTAGVIGTFIIALLLFVAPLTTVSIATAFVVTYALISAVSRKRLSANSAVLETAYDERLQAVQESLGGIRDVILDNAQSMYLEQFELVDAKLADARATTEFISVAPHYFIEMVGMAVIAAIALTMAGRSGGIAAALPVLGAVALGAQRLLPLVQQVYAGWSTLEGQRSIFAQVIALLRLPVTPQTGDAAAPLEVRKSIGLDAVSFSYPTRSHPAVDHVSLTIPQGTMLALAGPTGSGKSTLLDLLMGLLQPDDGRILIDEVPLEPAAEQQWHRSIAHVPQSIFLADSTIARNIALSLPDAAPDQNRIIESAKKAQLHDFVMSLPAGYETFVGERGVRLSGGQRQRLGIARAIYKDSPVLILDEATSAVDEAIETEIMASLDELRREGRTIVVVAHRLSTIRHCDLVARLEHGRIVHLGPPDKA